MPALYALGQHAALERAPEDLREGEFLAAFLDDLYVVTTKERAREAFAEGGNRKDFAAAFYTDEVAALLAPLYALGGTAAPPLSKELTAALSAGPLLVDLKLPLSDASAEAAKRKKADEGKSKAQLKKEARPKEALLSTARRPKGASL